MGTRARHCQSPVGALSSHHLVREEVAGTRRAEERGPRGGPWRLAMEGGGRTERGSCSRDAEGSQQPLGTSLPWALGMGSQHQSTCRRAVQASLATCSSVGEGKVSLPGSSLSPTRPAGFQGEMGLARAAPTTTNPPGLSDCQRAGLARPAWKILGSHSGSFWGFSQAAAPPPLPRTVLIRPRRRAPSAAHH